jgi:hypothetical protein
MDTTQLVRDSHPIGQPPITAGYISRLAPAPTTFDAPVYVVIPTHSPDHSYGPCVWPVIHGGTKPAQGTPCIVAFDDTGVATVISWTGVYSDPPNALHATLATALG